MPTHTAQEFRVDADPRLYRYRMGGIGASNRYEIEKRLGCKYLNALYSAAIENNVKDSTIDESLQTTRFYMVLP